MINPFDTRPSSSDWMAHYQRLADKQKMDEIRKAQDAQWSNPGILTPMQQYSDTQAMQGYQPVQVAQAPAYGTSRNYNRSYAGAYPMGEAGKRSLAQQQGMAGYWPMSSLVTPSEPVETWHAPLTLADLGLRSF